MKILVATDGSKHSLRAVKFAAMLLAQMNVPVKKITLISVHDDVSLRHARSFVGASVVDEYLRELSEKDLKPARKALDALGIQHDMVISTGHVAAEIVAHADKGKFDMIVLGSKGRGAVADLLIGSVAQRVQAHARQPVVLVK